MNVLSYNSLLPLVFTISSFVLFLRCKLQIPKRLATIWGEVIRSIFVVYLIQEHNTVRDWLWRFVGIQRWAMSPYLILIIFAVFAVLLLVAIVLSVCFYWVDKLLLSKLTKKIEQLVLKMLKIPSVSTCEKKEVLQSCDGNTEGRKGESDPHCLEKKQAKNYKNNLDRKY